MQITPRVFLNLNPRSLAGKQEQSRGARRFPARSGFGGMGKVGETLEEVDPHPLVLVSR